MYSDAADIKNLCLTGHTVKALNRAGLYAVGQLKEMSDIELLEIKGIGLKSLDEITHLIPDRIRKRKNESAEKSETEKLTPEELSGIGGITDDMNLNVLRLSTRTLKALERAKIRSVGKVKQYTDRELLSIRNIGTTAIEEINRFIPNRIKERDDAEKTELITSENIINMLESGLSIFDIQIRYNRGYTNIVRILCEHCDDFPESVDRLIAIYERQFEKADRFYGLLKEEKRRVNYCKAMG